MESWQLIEALVMYVTLVHEGVISYVCRGVQDREVHDSINGVEGRGIKLGDGLEV